MCYDKQGRERKFLPLLAFWNNAIIYSANRGWYTLGVQIGICFVRLRRIRRVYQNRVRGGSNMKKIPMILMLCAPYLLFGLYMSENIKALSAGLILFAAVMLFGALYAFFLPRIDYGGDQILFWCMLLKIFNIPVFLLIFVVALGLFVVIIPLIPLLFLFDYFLLMATSMYGLNGLLKCRKEKRLPAKSGRCQYRPAIHFLC